MVTGPEVEMQGKLEFQATGEYLQGLEHSSFAEGFLVCEAFSTGGKKESKQEYDQEILGSLQSIQDSLIPCVLQ